MVGLSQMGIKCFSLYMALHSQLMRKGLEVIIWDASDFILVSSVSLARTHDIPICSASTVRNNN